MSAIPKDAENRLVQLARAFSAPSRRASFFGPLYVAILALCAAAFVARFGVLSSRLLALLVLVSPLFVLVPLFRRSARERRRPLLLAQRAVRAVDEAGAGKLSQALGLLGRLEEGRGGESTELAELHLSRVLDGVSKTEIEERGRARGRWLSAATFLLFGGAAFAVLVHGFSVVEGLNILVSRGGIAPFSAPYLEDVEVLVEPPPQIKSGVRRLPLLASRALLPLGSELRVRILPRVAGRSFVLTDGQQENPFVSDGRGSLVARLKITDPSDVRVAAVFGDVRVFARESIKVSTIDDYPPEVGLLSGQRELPLATLERLELKYLARDDYGISLVELVIRTGRREERTELARFDDGERLHMGAHAVPADHPLLQGAFLPVSVWVEARDNNLVTQPGVGRSEVVTLLPRPLGEVLGSRHRKLRAFRSELVDFLATVLEGRQDGGEPTADTSSIAAAHEKLQERFERLELELLELPDPPRGSLQFLRAQLENLEELSSGSIESVVLATDVLLSELSRGDARTVAEDLAAAVDELAARAHEGDAPRAELESLLAAARQGAKQLADVGELGLDLGSVAGGDLDRIARLVVAGQGERARAAALHLAARLRRGTPSFGAKSAGVESGAPSRGGSPSGAPSTAPSDYDELIQQADDLAQQHAGQLSELERLLEEASRAAAQDAARRPENSRLAEELREALSELPSLARFPGTADAEAAAARGFGEAMADSLDAGRLPDADDRGAAALEALGRAEELRDAMGGYVSQRELRRARDALQKAQRGIERQRARELADPEMQAQLRQRADLERALAARAKELSDKGQRGEAKLPERTVRGLLQAARLMDDAASAMQRGDAEQARRLSSDAQRKLEAAQPEKRQSGDSRSSPDSFEDDSATPGKVDVPGESTDPAKEFRQRVEEGLGRYPGRYGPAVRRYAEELK